MPDSDDHPLWRFIPPEGAPEFYNVVSGIKGLSADNIRYSGLTYVLINDSSVKVRLCMEGWFLTACGSSIQVSNEYHHFEDVLEMVEKALAHVDPVSYLAATLEAF